MFNLNEILTQMDAGMSPEELANEFTTTLNKAIALQKEKEEKENTLHKGIIIAAIVAVVVGAVIIIIVLTKKEKKGDIPAEDKAPENDNKEE